MTKINLKGMTQQELENYSLSIGEKPFRGKQLFNWLYNKQASSFNEMSSLAKSLRMKLNQQAFIYSIQLVSTVSSPKDGTTKFLFQLNDNNRIESVLVLPRTTFADVEAENQEEQKRLTLCVSTQVGCPLDCKFCATAKMGFYRNLTASEIIDQLIQVRKITGKHVSNLVFMGMGEPLMNYSNVMKSVEIITTAMGIAARRITISTAGWIPGILKMADENRKVKLSVSLNTLVEDKRSQLMPLNKKYPLAKLLDAIQYYYKKTKRRVTFEYILFDGWNDEDADATRLIKLTKSIPSKVNIIPFNRIRFINTEGLTAQLHPTPVDKADRFIQNLRKEHVTVFVRNSTGEDISAACGQLAVSVAEDMKKPNFPRFIHN